MTARNDEIPVRLDGLQLDERPRLQSVIWIVQRGLWILWLITVLAALAGATGQGGPLADQTLRAPMAMLDSPRITRRLASDRITLRFAAPRTAHSLILPPDFLAGFEIDSITPRPAREIASPQGVLLHFNALGPPPHHIDLSLRARQIGILETTLTLDGTALPLRVTVLP